jgi:hypothetical protein
MLIRKEKLITLLEIEPLRNKLLYFYILNFMFLHLIISFDVFLFSYESNKVFTFIYIIIILLFILVVFIFNLILFYFMKNECQRV